MKPSSTGSYTEIPVIYRRKLILLKITLFCLFRVVPIVVDKGEMAHLNSGTTRNNEEHHKIMSTIKYKATLSGGQERSGLCIIFRHPVRKNPDGSPVRVRRGLGTKVSADAQVLVDQMNQLLGDPAFWTPAAKSKADSMFDQKIVSAFYDNLLPAANDPWALREEYVPIPGPDDGYARARFLGVTGAGKTTLVRQIIGTDPAKERFPSTSTAKTTVCDIEIVMADGPFTAVVTFFPREQVRLLIDECALAAAVSHVFEKGELTTAAARLLEHGEQRFRLSYLLGSLKNNKDEISDDDVMIDSPEDEPADVTPAEREAMAAQILNYVGRIERVAGHTANALETQLGVKLARLERKELDAFQELFEDELRQSEDFHGIVDEIFDAVEERFEVLSAQGFRRDRNDWPLLWQFQTHDRAEFIKTVNRFSSNYAPNFGKLLTPLVEGIRVRGPFKPEWLPAADCKLVLMDGEGLGHTPDSSASISTSITERLREVDAVVLVDSAEQPMQAGPQALLRTLAASGHEKKLIVCFTHFDAVKGDNLPNVSSKKQHVFRSLESAIGSVREVLGRTAENALTRAVDERVFFVSSIQDPIKESARLTRSELNGLVVAIQKSIIPPAPTSVTPVYDVTNLILCIPQAMAEFREPWRARLRLPSSSNVSPEHWTRIKALSRRFAELGEIEYSSMRPVADFIARLMENISVFIATPIKWEPANAPEEMKRQVANEIAIQIFSDLHGLGTQRLFSDRVKDWTAAYSHRGPGSTNDRSNDIDAIYREAAPIPGQAGNETASKFVAELNLMVKTAVQKSGGKFLT